MEGLDFSTLSDDQLVGLLRSVLRECVERGAAVQAAAQSATVDEAERAKIRREAANREAAKLRAQERERIAREAAEEVRAKIKAAEAAANAATNADRIKREQEDQSRVRAAAAEKAREAAAASRQKDLTNMEWLRRAAALVDRHPKEIAIVLYERMLYDVGMSAWRVLINDAPNRYTRSHLADWDEVANSLETNARLLPRKSEIVAFCAEFHASHKREVALIGTDYAWEDTNS